MVVIVEVVVEVFVFVLEVEVLDVVICLSPSRQRPTCVSVQVIGLWQLGLRQTTTFIHQ